MKNVIRRVLNKVSPDLLDVYSSHFNTSVKYVDGAWVMNERIVEVGFVLSQIGLDRPGQRVLEFGCTKSDLALQLAAQGYKVVGIDLRPYTFSHPNLTFWQGNLLEYDNVEGFDYITSVSVIEHIGLGVYGESRNQRDLEEVIRKLTSLLKPGGKALITVPFGLPSFDQFFRSFSHGEIHSLFTGAGLALATERFYCRAEDQKSWLPCGLAEAALISNAPAERGPTGVNCVGCFAWQKPDRP